MIEVCTAFKDLHGTIQSLSIATNLLLENK